MVSVPAKCRSKIVQRSRASSNEEPSRLCGRTEQRDDENRVKEDNADKGCFSCEETWYNANLFQFIHVAVKEMPWLSWNPGLPLFTDQMAGHFLYCISILKGLLKRQWQAPSQRKTVVNLLKTAIN